MTARPGPSSDGQPSAGEPRRRAGCFGLSDGQITSVSGSVSGFMATFAKQPIQRVKWMRQIDAGAAVPYRDVLRRTLQAEGALGLFRGSLAGITRNVPHSALVYSLYPACEAAVQQQQRRRVVATGGGDSAGANDGAATPVSFSTRFWAGYATLMMATVVTHPLDTIRVRISVTQGEVSTAQIFRQMVQGGGWHTFYQGYGATLLGAGPRGALGFGVFETLKQWGAKHELLPGQPTLRKLVYGYVAGICAETMIYPLDTVRRRQQALGESSPLGKRNVISALIHLAQQEGFFGMFKGLSLNLVKNPIATAVSFAVNDLVKETLGHSEGNGHDRSGVM